MSMAEFDSKSATSAARGRGTGLAKLMTVSLFWHSSAKCILPSWMCLITGRRTRCSDCWIRWPLTIAIGPGRRRSSCGEPACGSPRSSSLSGGTWITRGIRRRCLVRKSKSRRARTVRLHPELVQLFTNWPVSRSPRDKLVPLSMRTALRHIGDGIEWAGLGEESPGTGRRCAGAHSA